MADCPKPVRSCAPQTLVEAAAPVCEDWTACLPFGATLSYENGCLKYTPGEPPEDGVYGLVTVQNGCIVGMDAEPVAKYQSDACAPVPCPCSEDSDTASDFCDASSVTGNLYSCDSTGKPLVRAYINGGDNVSVTGYGTLSNPFVISIDQGDAGVTSLRSTTDALVVSPNTGAVEISHKEGWNEQTINGMVFDKYGHLVDYDSTTSSTSLIGVVGTNGVSASTDSSGIVTVKLEDPTNKLTGDYLLGGWKMTLDSWNRVYNMSRYITVTETSYAFGPYDVTVNEFGSIEELTATNSMGNLFHALFNGDGESTTLTIDFTLRYATYLIIELTCKAGTSSWGDGLAVRMNGTTVSDKLVLVSSGPATLTGTTSSPTLSIDGYPTLLRACPGGIYSAGDHELVITQTSAGFPATGISVSIRSVTAFSSVSLSGSISS